MKITRPLPRWHGPAAALALLALACALPASSAEPQDDGDTRVKREKRTVIRIDDGSGEDLEWLFVDGEGEAPVVVRPRVQIGGYLGVGLVEVTPELVEFFGAPGSAGVLVSRIDEESPAARAGVRVGDLLTAIDGEPMRSGREVASTIRRRGEGETVELQLYRGGRPLTLEAALVERERPQVDLGNVFFRCRGEACADDAAPHIDHLSEVFPIDPGELQMRMDEIYERLGDPEWHQRVLEQRQGREGLANRLRELEERILELERQLAEERDD